MKFKVSFDDGRTLEVGATPGDIVRFERQYGFPASQIETDTRVEYVMFLAWCALKRTKQFDGDFDDFLDHVMQTEDEPSPPVPPPA